MTPAHPKWLEISIHTHPVVRDALGAFLFDLGCTGIVTEDFEDDTLRAYLPASRNPEDLRARIVLFLNHLKKIFPEFIPSEPVFRSLADQDWSRNWRRFFRPERVTPGLMIHPAWESGPAPPDCRLLRIDPGPAFGTGGHATTRMCLRAMETVPVTGKPLLDVGTGSGILAMYGAILGAGPVVAVDIDPEALRWAKQNLRLNGLERSVSLSGNPVEKLKGVFSLITANLVLDQIRKLMPHFSRLTLPGGRIILSGILKEQVPGVTAISKMHGFRDHDIRHEEEWACVICRKSTEEEVP